MILFINTSDFNALQFALIGTNAKIIPIKKFSENLAFNENYKTNLLLEKFLKKSKVSPQQLTQIIACSGPGSFTGIRVGVSLAQALGFALNIPVHTIEKENIPDELEELKTIKLSKKNLLHYGQEPNITPVKNKTR